MKNRPIFFVKTAIILFVSAALLVGGIMAMPLFSNGTKALHENQLAPNVNIPTNEAPITQTQLSDKFGIYSFASEENGKSVMTLYSEEQISDFKTRRNNGEWFSLTAEEILYLIDDTQQLLEQYGEIQIRNFDGNIVTYRKSYTDKYDGYIPNYGGGLTEAAYHRISVLASSSEPSATEWPNVVFSDVNYATPHAAISEMASYVQLIFAGTIPQEGCEYIINKLHQYPSYGVFVFVKEDTAYKKGIYYLKDISDIDLEHINASYLG